MKKLKFEGLHCPNCAKTLESKINKLESIKSAQINFLKEYIAFDADDYNKAETDIINLAKQLEPDMKIFATKNTSGFNKKFIIDTIVLIVGVAVGLIALFINMPTWCYWLLFVTSALLMGYKTYYKAIRLLLKGTINESLCRKANGLKVIK